MPVRLRKALFIASGSIPLQWQQPKSPFRSMGGFLTPQGACRPQTGAIPTFLILNNLWWRFRGLTRWHIARGFRHRLAPAIGFLQKPSGSGLREAVLSRCCFPGAMIRRYHVPATTVVGRLALSRSGNHSRMPTAYSTFARTCMSGAAIGTKPITMPCHLIEIRKGRKKDREELRAEVPGDTKSRFRDARHVLASRRNSVMLIMAFGSFATGLAEKSPHPSSTRLAPKSVMSVLAVMPRRVHWRR
jgi:hypothetical protein